MVAEPGPFKANLEKCRPIGVVTFLVDAPLTAKDVSLPITLCLSDLLEQSAAKTPAQV